MDSTKQRGFIWKKQMNLIDARSLEELKNLYEFTKYKSDDLVKKK